MPNHLEPYERKSEAVRFRLTAAELSDVRRAAKTHGVTYSALIRHFIQEGIASFKRQGLMEYKLGGAKPIS